MVEEKKYLTTNDVMKMFSVTRLTVNNWRKRGLKFKKIGSLVRFELEDINKFVEEENEKGVNNVN